MKLGLVTIGQSPRDDVVPEIRQYLPPGVEILEAGALDGLSPGEIAAHAPASPERTLVTRLRDGREVVVDAEFVHRLLQGTIEELAKEVEIIGLLCSGRFPKLASPVPLLVPHELMRGFLSALVLPGPLGVLVPSPQQVAPTKREFQSWSFEVLVKAASPYRGSIEEMKRQAIGLTSAGAEAIFLNCFGYSIEGAEFLRSKIRKPVISARTVFICALKELL